MYRTIQLTEGDLNRIVRNSVKQILSEQEMPIAYRPENNNDKKVLYLCKCAVHIMHVNKVPIGNSPNVMYNKMLIYLKMHGVNINNQRFKSIAYNYAKQMYTYSMNQYYQKATDRAFSEYQKQAQAAYNKFQQDSLNYAQRRKASNGIYDYRTK